MALTYSPLPDRLELATRLRHGYRIEDTEVDRRGHLAAGRWRGTYRLGRFGRFSFSFEYLTDYVRTSARFRLMGLLDFDLEVL